MATAVQDFYERYPYPRPIDDLDYYRLLWQDRNKRRADHHLFWPDRVFREDHAILVAGCGTSQAAKHAIRWPHARVTGIDFSATSVAHTEALKRKYQLDNLDVHQLPVERVHELAATFDQIVCTGVLHHLADPAAGLHALRDMLAADGAIHLMVYAPYGRAGIYMLQEFCRRIGVQPTDDEIRDLIAALEALPSGHPLAILLREAPDFRQPAALADALLHPQDRAYAVPQLLELLETARLTFGRWVRQAPYSRHCGLIARLPHASRIAQLPLADQSAAAELFRGTMVSHSLVAYRSDRHDDASRVGFSGDAWLAYVPIRMPDTIAVQERLPAGAAAVLINRTHTDRDLFLPIDADERRLLEGIDGVSRISEIVERTLSPSQRATRPDLGRQFFERLWWHDQVVFDASPSHRSERTSEP